MTSTGNDLVFLPATQPERTILPRFYSIILNALEVEDYQYLASSTLPFDHYVWLCWSIKESAFKYLKRGSPDLVFAPLKIAVRRIDPPTPPAASTSPTPPTQGQDFYAGTAEGYGRLLYSRSHCGNTAAGRS